LIVETLRVMKVPTAFLAGLSCAFGLLVQSAPVQSQIVGPMETVLQGSYRDEPFGEPIPAFLNNGEPPLLLMEGVLDALNLEFQVQENGAIAGRVHPEDLAFSISTSGSYTIGSQSGQLEPIDFRVDQHEIYVSPQVLARLVPIEFSFNLLAQTFQVKATGPLALDIARQREVARARLASRLQPDDLPLADFPYQTMGRPFGDIRFNGQHNTDSNFHNAYSYDALLTQELGYATGFLFFSGNREDTLRDARLRFGRESPLGGVLGVPGLTSGFVGDVQPRSVPLVGGLNQSRGFTASAFPLDRPDRFDQTVIDGDAPPGWDAELFRERELLDFQQVGPDGRFVFSEVPLLFGTNRFRVVLYGPQGQRREQMRDIRVGTGMTPPGVVYWRAFAGQQNRRLLQGILPDLSQSEADVYSGEIELGLTPNLSANVFIARAPTSFLLDSKTRASTGGGLKISLGSLYLETEFARQDGGGDAWALGVSAGLGPISFFARHAEFDKFLSREASRSVTPLESESSLRLSSSIPVWGRAIGVSFSGNRWLSENGTEELSARAQARFAIGGVSLIHELDWRRFESLSELTNKRRYYIPSVSSSVRDLRFSANARYDLDNRHLEQVLLSANYRLNPKMSVSMGSSVSESYSTKERSYGYSVAVSRDFGPFYASVSASRRSDNSYFVGFGINMSFGVHPQGGLAFSSRPMAQQGSADIFVFTDRNANGRFDEGVDAPVPNAKLRMSRLGGDSLETDDSGVMFLTGLQVNQPVVLQIDSESLDDPFLTVKNGGLRFVPRPGQPFQAQLALVDTGEIAGTLVVERNGKLIGLSGVVVELLAQIPKADRPFQAAGFRLFGEQQVSESGNGNGESNGTGYRTINGNGSGNDNVENGTNGTNGSFSARYGGYRLLSSKRTRFDGAFSFDLVPPGDYLVRIREGQSIRGYSLEPVGQVVKVSVENLMIEGVEIRLLAPIPDLAKPTLPEEPSAPAVAETSTVPAPEVAEPEMPVPEKPIVVSEALQ
jgi:hypothetical protein